MLLIAIQTDFVQNQLIGLATNQLSKELKTEVKIQHISISLFNKLNLEGALIRDQKNDTLLYAGKLKLRITDWFFLKETTTIKYLGLEEATVKLNRNSPKWNYAFIEEYFSSPNPKKQPSKISIDLNKIDLKQIRFEQKDEWVGETLTLHLGSLLLDAESIDLNKKHFLINTLQLDKPEFKIQDLKGLRPDSLSNKKNKVDTGYYFNGADIHLKIAKLSINDGVLFFDGNMKTPDKLFDGSHIQLSNLNGNLSNLSIAHDTIKAFVDLNVKDRCGLQLKKLQTNFKLTPQILELNNLNLQTNKSILGPYYAMQFKDFNKDFGDYINKVIMKAKFSNATIHSDDIAYFAPELTNWKKQLTLSGNFLGTVKDFQINQLAARIGGGTQVSGSLSMKGLPDVEKMKIDFTNGTVNTNYTDLQTFIPIMKGIHTPNLGSLGQIIYRGSFHGTIHNFVTKGMLSTKLGGIDANISMQLPPKGEPNYQGTIETNHFNIGEFLNDSLLGHVNYKGNITGTGFTLDKIKTTLEGKASSFEYNHYTYTNITTIGTFQKKYFNGELKIDDPNLDFTSSIEIDFTQALPKFNIVGDLVHSNLKALHLWKDSVMITGLLDVNFTGTNIDNFLGSAKFLNAGIQSPIEKLNFDSLIISSDFVDSVKTLSIQADDLSASIKGRFSIMELPNSFQAFLTRYYPTYIPKPKNTPINQVFNFTIKTNYIERFYRLFERRISGFNEASLSGSIDTRKNLLDVAIQIPTGKFDHYSFTGIDLIGIGNKDSLKLIGNISSTQLSDSLRFPNTSLNIMSGNDHSLVSIQTSASNTINDANLFADVYTLADGLKVNFRKSSIVLNERKWNIEENGEINYRNNLVQAKGLKLTQGFQEIAVESIKENNNSVAIHLKNLAIGDLISIAFKSPKIEGVATGEILLKDITGKFTADANIVTEQFRLDEDSVGLIKLIASYNQETGNIPFTIESPNEAYQFLAQGKYNVKDTSNQSLSTNIRLDNSKIDILHIFLSDLFSNIEGKATGNLHIGGNINAPDLKGKLLLSQAGMKVNYTQVYYTIDSAVIQFTDEGIDFGTITIQDIYKNKGVLRGMLYEKGFKNMKFDFELNTEKLLLIDTKEKDNQQFYGKAIGKANLKMLGPETDAKMTIVAEANDSSHIYIPNSVNKESGNADFIVFKEYGTEIIEAKEKSAFNINVELDITATNQVQIDVILDELSGDVIKAVGNGKLKIKAGSTEPLSIRGRYNIEKGDYVFNFQGLLRKPFILLPDAGNFIEWTGDPFNADLHIDAQYIAERISLSELVGNLNMSPAVKGYRGDVYVIAQLREKLTKPDIKFKLDFPQGSPVKSDNEFSQYITRLEKDQNEILNQVAFLILFNSFAPQTGSGNNSVGSAYAITSLGVNTLSSLLTKSVNKAVTNLLYQLTGDKSLRFDVGTSIYSSSNVINPGGDINATSSNKLDRTRVDLKFGYAFDNDKILVTVGSDIDFNIGNSAIQNGNTQWLPNITIEFILSNDRKLRLIVFNKASLDLSGTSFGRRNRQGISITYRKDFETLFKKENEIELAEQRKK